MVPRIFREGICCSPSKFRRPKFNVIYSIERSTSSNQPPDGVDMCKKYQRTIDYTLGSHHYDDPNKLRPTVYIAHTTVFDTNKDGEKNTETLLESLQRKLAWQQRIRQNLSVDEAQKNEASADEVAAEADKKGDHFATDGSLQTDNVWRYATMYDSDVTKDDKLVQKPEPFHEIDENRVFVDPPSLRPAHNRYRYEMDSEAQAYDELAKKYLTMERDQVDKRLLQDMERLGLPIDTSEATSPPININVSCEKEGVHEVVAPKHAESQQREATINNNPQYYDQISWCNLYFQNEHLSEIPSSEEGVPENDKGFGPNAFHYDMLPLHCYLDFDPFDESNEINKSIEKLGFEEHDDILPFHLLQCQDFIQLDLKVSNDNNKVNSPLESINVDDIQPNHFALQGNLMNEVASTSNAIEALEQYDFNRSLEELYVGHTEPVADVFHSLMYDMDVTKFDYTFPRDNINVEFSLNNQHENHKFQTVKDTPQESGTIIQIEDQTMPKKELKKEKEDKLKLLSHVNLAKPKVAQQQINLSQKVHKATNDNKSDTIVQANLNLVKPKVAEQQINLSQKVQNATNDKKSDTIVLANPEPNLAKPKVAEQQINLFQKVQKATNNKTSDTIVIANPEPNLAKPKVAEQQINLSQKVEKATNDKQSGTIVQANPELNPKTEVELRDFINAKVMEQVRAYTPSENTTRPHERLDNLVQVNPESLPNHELKPHVNFAKPNVAEQLMDVLQNVKKATNNNKSDTVVQPHPVPSPKTEAELRNFINAKVMEQVGAHTASDTRTKPRERFDRLVQMNPPSPQHNDVTNIIHARILEQVRAPPPSLKLTTNSVKGIDSIIQMQPQAAFEIKPEKVAHKEPLTETKLMNDNATCQTTPTLEKAQITTKPTEEQNSEQPNTNTAVKAEETKKTSGETGTIVQSCVQTATSDIDDAANKLSLDLNLSLSELLRRVRARNRLQYLNDIKAQIENMTILNSEKRCPPSDRPQCPPPPECIKPCPPPPKPKCPPAPPKCPPDPPKCPPEPPKCPPPKDPPKCPPDPPKCPPEPPKCPPEPKCPCPCPPPPKCPPEPPKCPCQATNADDPVTIPPYLTLLDTGTGFLRIVIELIKKGFLESRNMLFPVTKDNPFEITSLKLNRIRDFEPWTPVPSWPFPVQHKKRKLQCPYHGCPYPKPGPVRPNCPELPCPGFPKRLSFSETDIHYLLKTD